MTRTGHSLSGLIAPLLLGASIVGAVASWKHLNAPPPAGMGGGEMAFSRMMVESMAQMSAGATSAPMVGNVDRDFATMMVVHHLGAIDMARAELLHGSDPILRRLAQEIVVTQSAEITVLRDQIAQADTVCR